MDNQINLFPLVSVIIPCYNARNTIADTINSVLCQTYKNIEVLIIDDCSTDNSYEIINNYAACDSRIRFFKTTTPSGSPAIPRNIGLDNSHGTLIAFLDADDMWLESKLEDQITFMQSNNYDFVYSDCEKILFDGTRTNRIIRFPKKSTFHDILKYCSIPSPTTLIKKELVGIKRFNNAPKEDYIFWLDILRDGVIAYNTGLLHGLYRLTPNSRSSNKMYMVKNQWNILRNLENINLLSCGYLMLTYIIKSFKKYLI